MRTTSAAMLAFSVAIRGPQVQRYESITTIPERAPLPAASRLKRTGRGLRGGEGLGVARQHVGRALSVCGRLGLLRGRRLAIAAGGPLRLSL